MTFAQAYWIGVLVALAWGVISNYSFRYIARYSDGGGWDAGSSYGFHPYLKISESEVHKGEMMAWQGTDIGEKILRVAVKFIPFYAVASILIWLMFFIIPVLMWALFPNDKHRPREFNVKQRCTRPIQGWW